MSGITQAQLSEEQKSWRKDNPFGFIARCMKNTDRSINVMLWGQIIFEDLLSTLPKVKFVPPLFQPNVHPSGTECLSLLDEEKIGDLLLQIIKSFQEYRICKMIQISFIFTTFRINRCY